MKDTLEYAILLTVCVIVALVYVHLTKHSDFEDVLVNIIACLALFRTCSHKRKE